MSSDYISAALMILVGVGFALLLTAAAKYLGPHRPNKAKDYPYECGSEPIGTPRARFSVKFYQVAILFLVFDIEAAFLYPWALLYRELSCHGAARRGRLLGRRLVLRLRRDAGVRRDPRRRARLRLAKAGDRMGVKATGWASSCTPRKLAERRQLGAQVLAVQVPVRHRVLRHGVHVASPAPKYDIARFGAEFPRFSPRQTRSADDRRHDHREAGPGAARVYDQMAEPKWVIAFGVCASTGGFYQNYSTMPGADQVIPVDVYIPGCPPRPEQVLDGADAAHGSHPERARATARSASSAEKCDIPLAAIRPISVRAERDVSSTRERSRTRDMAQIVLDTLVGHSRRRVEQTGSQHGDERARVRRDDLARSRRACATTRRPR